MGTLIEFQSPAFNTPKQATASLEIADDEFYV